MIGEGPIIPGPVRPETKKGSLLFDEMNRLLVDKLRGQATIDQAITVVMRVMRPYLRNRFSIQDTSTPFDRAQSRLRITLIDHAERRVASPDDIVIAFQDLQPCQPSSSPA